MPPNERRRNFKIVAPQEPSREEELIGGLQNALLRGENIDKAKQSFMSAGYKPEEVEAAATKTSATPKAIQQTPAQPNQKKQKPQTTTTTTAPKQQKKASKKFLIIIISIAVLILIGVGLLGLFWDKIF